VPPTGIEPIFKVTYTLNIGNLEAGTYKLVLTDTDCAALAPAEVEVTLELADVAPITNLQKTDETKPACKTTAPFDGVLKFKATGPSSMKYELWLNGKIVQTNTPVNNNTETVFSGLDAGFYKVIVTDNNCASNPAKELEVILELADVAPLVLQKKTETKPTCGSSNGVLTFEGSGGSASSNLRYTWWQNDKILHSAGNATYNNLAAGKYKVVLTDVGCPSNPPKEIEVELAVADATPITGLQRTNDATNNADPTCDNLTGVK
jgi:hypothetical protein